jgi:hypothetical protein
MKRRANISDFGTAALTNLSFIFAARNVPS